MAHYVDGYVLPVPKRNVDVYRRLARKAGKTWREHGALEFRECVGDDLDVSMGAPFPGAIKLKPGETVMFSWIVFRSRAHREAGPGVDAIRLQPHGLRRLQGPGRRLSARADHGIETMRRDAADALPPMTGSFAERL